MQSAFWATQVLVVGFFIALGVWFQISPPVIVAPPLSEAQYFLKSKSQSFSHSYRQQLVAYPKLGRALLVVPNVEAAAGARLNLLPQPTIGNELYFSSGSGYSRSSTDGYYTFDLPTLTFRRLPNSSAVSLSDHRSFDFDKTRFLSISAGDGYRILYLVDLAQDSIRAVKQLPENETFARLSDGGGAVFEWDNPNGVNVTVYDATAKVSDPYSSRKERPAIRTEGVQL